VEHALALGLQQTGQLVLAWFTEHEPLLIFLAILFEECGIPMPLPADLAMALAGYRVAQGKMTLWQAFLIGQSATLIGSSILYWVGRQGGRPLLFRYGKLLHLSGHRLAQIERLIVRLGPLAVIIGRQIPGLRLAAPLSCGVFRVPYRLFAPAMVVGSSVYIALFLVLGMWGGPALLTALRVRELPIGLVLSTILLVAAGLLLRQLARRAQEVAPSMPGYPSYRLAAARRRVMEAALLAGLGASAILSLIFTWVLDLVGLLAHAPPERALYHLLQSSARGTPVLPALSPLHLLFVGLIATGPFQVATFLFWSLVYAFTFQPRARGPAALRGLQFSVIPWLCSMLVLFPLIGAGPFGVHLHAGPLPALGELARLAVFCTILGPLYRLLWLARLPRPHEGHRHGHRHHAAVPLAHPPTEHAAAPAASPVGSPAGGAASHAPSGHAAASAAPPAAAGAGTIAAPTTPIPAAPSTAEGTAASPQPHRPFSA